MLNVTETYNNTYNTKTNNSFVPYFALLIIFIGVLGNTTTFFLFRTDREMKKMPAMVYLSFTCVTDTLS